MNQPMFHAEANWRHWTVRALALIGLLVSAYLVWISISRGRAIGCGGDTLMDCSHVLTSRWATWFGIPVSLGGAMIYLGIVICSLAETAEVPTRQRRMASFIIRILAVIAAGAGLWFIGLQIREIGKLCPYCMAVHACGIIIVGLVFTDGRSASIHRVSPIACGLGALVLLVAGQLLVEPETAVVRTATIKDVDSPTINEPNQNDDWKTESGVIGNRNGAQDEVTFMDGALRFDPAHEMLLGSPDADHFVLEMFDYTCPHCHDLHKKLQEVKEEYGDQIAFILIAMPLSHHCNNNLPLTHPQHKEACELAKLVMAVYQIAPEESAAFHQWMFDGQTIRTYAEARTQAQTIATAKKLDDAIKSLAVYNMLRRNTKMYGQLGRGNIPKLLYANNMKLEGGVTHSLTLFDTFETNLGVKPVKR